MKDVLNNLCCGAYTHFPRINAGGCCVFAALVGKELEQLGYPVRIAVYQHWEGDINRARQNVTENIVSAWNSNGVNFTHVILSVKIKRRWYHCDAVASIYPEKDGNIGGGGSTKAHGYLTVQEASALAQDDNWNPNFDRTEISKLRKLVRSYFKSEEYKIAS